MPAFVYLEIANRELNYLFAGISEAINRKRDSRPAHLTLRGPYSGRVPSGTVARCREVLRHDVLEISGVGRFSNPDEEVVFLGVDSPSLRKVWWKPDYPIAKFDFNPHISLYRGEDVQLAQAIERFFIHESLRLLCAEFRIVARVTKQAEVFPPSLQASSFPFHEVLQGRIRENLLSRLKTVVMRERRRVSGGFGPLFDRD